MTKTFIKIYKADIFANIFEHQTVMAKADRSQPRPPGECMLSGTATTGT
jgi:hypothetical protein